MLEDELRNQSLESVKDDSFVANMVIIIELFMCGYLLRAPKNTSSKYVLNAKTRVLCNGIYLVHVIFLLSWSWKLSTSFKHAELQGFKSWLHIRRFFRWHSPPDWMENDSSNDLNDTPVMCCL